MSQCRTHQGVHVPGCMGCAVYGHFRCNCSRQVPGPLLPDDLVARIRSLEQRVERLEHLVTWPLRDPQALDDLLALHAVPNPRILDCTYGRGFVWGDLPIRQSVVRADVNPELIDLDLVSSWADLPTHFPPWSFDVLVWDPIHVTDVGRSSRLYSRYVSDQHPVTGSSISPLFVGFLDVAQQLLVPRTGIVLAKISDQVHNSRQRWQLLSLVTEAQRHGWTACDYTIVRNTHGTHRDPKHKTQYHMPNQWAFWIVLRLGHSCRGPGRPFPIPVPSP